MSGRQAGTMREASRGSPRPLKILATQNPPVRSSKYLLGKHDLVHPFLGFYPQWKSQGLSLIDDLITGCCWCDAYEVSEEAHEGIPKGKESPSPKSNLSDKDKQALTKIINNVSNYIESKNHGTALMSLKTKGSLLTTTNCAEALENLKTAFNTLNNEEVAEESNIEQLKKCILELHNALEISTKSQIFFAKGSSGKGKKLAIDIKNVLKGTALNFDSPNSPRSSNANRK